MFRHRNNFEHIPKDFFPTGKTEFVLIKY